MPESIIDRTVLESLLQSVQGDREFLAELAQDYYDNSAQLLAQAEQCLAEGNASELRRAVHSLKSNSASFGATELARMCKDLELLSSAGRLESAQEHLERIRREFEIVKTALQAEISHA